MRIKTTFAVMIAALAFGAPVAAADPDTYRSAPQSLSQTSVQLDAVDRYVANASRSGGQPDALDRYLRNHATGAATHLDSPGVRPGRPARALRFRMRAAAGRTRRSSHSSAASCVLLAVVGASATRERRRPILR